jgi:cyclophilin family peptidyl-prolyl cis-trans isomerase
MVQGGDPTGTGRGGESIYGYALIFILFCHLQHMYLESYSCSRF